MKSITQFVKTMQKIQHAQLFQTETEANFVMQIIKEKICHVWIMLYT